MILVTFSTKSPSLQQGVTRYINHYLLQLRMDFSTFVIAGPTTLTTTVAKELGGSMGTAAGSPVNLATECLTDTFSMTGPAGSVPPIICGTNSGEHGEFLP